MPGTLGPLSSVGDGIFPIVVAADVLRHRSPIDLGYVLGTESVALVAVALVGGVMADRFRRTRVMAVADLLRLLGCLGFVLGAARGPLALMLACAAAMGLGSGLFRPAYNAVIP